MPTFDDVTTTAAPVEEVWKLLYDPARFPEWWQGMETVERRAHEGRGDFTMYPDGYPDFPMPQELRADLVAGRSRSRAWSATCVRLAAEPLAGTEGTRIAVHVELPEQEAHRLEGQRDIVSASLAPSPRWPSAALRPHLQHQVERRLRGAPHARRTRPRPAPR